MKKIYLLLFATMLLAACGDSDSTAPVDKEPEENTETPTSDAANEDNSNKPEVEVEEVKAETIVLNETTIVEDFAEITVNSNKFGKRIDPPSPGSFYTYYENKEVDQIYLDSVISTKSLLTAGKRSDEFMKVKIVYDNKYEYTTFSAIEKDGGSNFTYTNITSIDPLQTGVLHFLASLPTEVETDGKPLKAVITVNGEEYEQIIR